MCTRLGHFPWKPRHANPLKRSHRSKHVVVNLNAHTVRQRENFRTAFEHEKTNMGTEARTLCNNQLLPASQPTRHQRNKKCPGTACESTIPDQKIEAQPTASLEHLNGDMCDNSAHHAKTDKPRIPFRMHQIRLSTMRSGSQPVQHTNCVTSNKLFAVTSTEQIGLARVLFPTR